MNYSRISILLILVVSVVLGTGCAMGNSPQSAFERAYFAALAKHDLEVTAKSTSTVFEKYGSLNARLEYEALENEFADAAAIIASDSNISSERKAKLITRLYRQYGDQRGRLERELIEDKAKGDVLINNIMQGGANIEALQIAEELEASSEIDYSDFVGDLIIQSGERFIFEAENMAAQRAADAALERRLQLLQAIPEPEEEATFVEDPVKEVPTEE